MNTIKGNEAGTWHNLGGKFVGDSLTAVSWATDRIDVFGIGMKNSLLHNWYSGGKWNTWEDFGGVFIGKPKAVSAREGRLDIFVKGMDSCIYHKVSRARHFRVMRELGLIDEIVLEWPVAQLSESGRGSSL